MRRITENCYFYRKEIVLMIVFLHHVYSLPKMNITITQRLHFMITITPANTKHLYNICTMLDQRRRRVGRRCTNVMKMLCVCWDATMDSKESQLPLLLYYSLLLTNISPGDSLSKKLISAFQMVKRMVLMFIPLLLSLFFIQFFFHNLKLEMVFLHIVSLADSQ